MTDMRFIMGGMPDEDYAPRSRRVRSWSLEFDSDGTPYTWRGNAHTQAAAEQAARHELAQVHPSFNRTTARLTACLER